jgi:AAA+ ATPase superfamily predicted ATPase
LSVLEAIGRGAERPSEIARRLGVPQTNLGRLFEQLLDASLVTRELPFGESLRSTKRVLYRIADPALRFWFRVYSPHRTLWRQYSTSRRRELIHQHAATVFEDYCRDAVSGASRYWENDLEIDFVAPVAADPQSLQVVEVKWRQLTTVQRSQIERDLREKWQRSALAGKYPHPVFRVIDARALVPDQ